MCELTLVPPRKRTGNFHLAGEVELPVKACYPAKMYGKRGTDPLGAPAWDDAPVRLGPNEHPDNLMVHARAAYDIAAFAIDDSLMPLPGHGTSTLVAPPTIAVDPGYHTGITVRHGVEALNWATIAPPEPYKTVDDFELVDQHVDKILTMVSWFRSQYRQHGPWTLALELLSTRGRRPSRLAIPLQITSRQVQVLLRELPRLGAEPIEAEVSAAA